MKKIKAHSAITRAASLFLIALITIGLTACDKPTSEETAYLEFPAYSAKKQYKVAGRDFDNAEPKLGSLIIEIRNTSNNKRITRFDNLKNEGIKVAVPPNTRLLVTGVGFIDAQIKYEGKILIDPIKPGESENAKLILQSVETNQALQIDIAIDDQPANGRSKGLRFFDNGNSILFTSNSSNLVLDDSNELGDVYLKNLDTAKIGALSLSNESENVADADISEDGTYVVFSSTADTLVDGDTNGVADIFLKNITTNEIERISLENGAQKQKTSTNPQISDDGTIISYQTQDEEDAISTIRLFNRLTKQQETLAIDSTRAILSGDGEWIVYQNSNEQLRLFNISSKDDISISDETLDYSFNITQDGSAIAFIPSRSGKNLTENQFYVFTYANNPLTRQFSKNLSGISISSNLTQTTLPAISGNGRYIAFSYDDTVYIIETENNNFTQFSGADPFLSKDGRKIGYSKDDNLFSIDNPIYVRETIIEKATAPTNLTISTFLGGFILEWETVENAKYYRVLQTTEAAAAIIGDIIPRSSDDSPLVVYETTNNNLTINSGLSNGVEYIFYVAAVNNQGRGALSNKVSEIADIDEIPPRVESIASPSTVEYITERRIRINFSEAIEPSTANSNSITLTDSKDRSITFSVTTSGAVVTLSTSTDLQYGETYTVNVTTDVTDLAGNALQSAYRNSITTWLPNYQDEGTFETPKEITGGSSSGMVGTGTSFYQLAEQEIPSDRYLIIINGPNSLSSRLTDIEGMEIPENSANTYVAPSAEFTLAVFGSQTTYGAAFSIEILEIDDVNVTGMETVILTTLADVNSQALVRLSGLPQDTNYALDFFQLGTSEIRIQSLFDNTIDCLVSSATPVCELSTIENGIVYLRIQGTNNISDLIVGGEILTIQTVAQLPPLSLYDERIQTSSNITLYKYTDLAPNRNHALRLNKLPNESTETIRYTLYTDNWSSVQCANAISITTVDTCLFNPPSADNSYYLRIEDSRPIDNSTIVTKLTYAYDVNELISFTVGDNEATEYFVVSGLTENTNYTVILSSNIATNAFLEMPAGTAYDEGWCSAIHELFSVSCDAYTDPAGILYFTFGGSSIAATMNVSIVETSTILTVNSISSPSTENFTVSDAIFLEFSALILSSTANTDNIKLFNREQSVPLTISSEENIVTLTTEENLYFDEEYIVTISTGVTGMSGATLQNLYSNSFRTWAPSDEGSAANPLPISEGFYQGSVNTGASFYNFSIPTAPADQYLIRVNTQTNGLLLMLTDAAGTTYPNQITGANIDYLISGLDSPSPFTLEINGAETDGGATFSIEILGIDSINVGEMETITLATLADVNSQALVRLSGLPLDVDFALDFSQLGTNEIRVQSLFDNAIDCRVSSAAPVCELHANENGAVYLSIQGVNNVNELVVTGEILNILTATQSPPLRLYSETIDTPSSVTLYKYTGLVPNRSHALISDTLINGTSRYTLYTNNWRSVQCSNPISTNIDGPCIFSVPANDNSYYLRIENDIPNSTVDIDLIYAYDANELTSFMIQNDETTEYFAVTGLTASTAYVVTLSSDTPTGGSLETLGMMIRDCDVIHTEDTVTCVADTDSSGILYFTFGGSSLIATMSVSIEESTATLTVESMSSPSTEINTVADVIFLTFSSAILSSTANNENIKLYNGAQEILLSISTEENIVTLTTAENLRFNEEYTVIVSTSVADSFSATLQDVYSNSFSTWAPSNEGSATNPLPINEGFYQGSVRFGTSFYSFDISEEPADQYFIRVNTQTNGLTSALIGPGGASYTNQTMEPNAEYLISSIDSPSTFTLVVFGANTDGGAAFSIEVFSVNRVDAIVGQGNVSLATLADTNPQELTNLSGLSPNTSYALDFSLTGTDRISIQTIFNGGTNCTVSETNSVCEIESDSNGELLLSISALSGEMNGFEVTSEVFVLSVRDLSDFTSTDFQNIYFSLPKQFIKYTNLPSSGNYALLLNTLELSTSYKLYTNNWSNLECSSEITNTIEETCLFSPSAADNSYFLRVENLNAPTEGNGVVTQLVNAYTMAEMQNFDVSQNFDENGTREYFAITGLTPNSNYTIKLSSNIITNGWLETLDLKLPVAAQLRWCSITHDVLSVSCDANSDNSGILYFEFGYSSVDATMDVVIEQTPPNMVGRLIMLDTIESYPISPIETFIVNPVSIDAPHIVHATFFSEDEGAAPKLTIFNSQQTEICSASEMFFASTLACLVYPDESFMQFSIEDGVTASLPATYANIIVSEVTIGNMASTPLRATMESSFAVYAIENPLLRGDSVEITLRVSTVEAGNSSARISFSLYQDQQLTNPLCTSRSVSPPPPNGGYIESCTVRNVANLPAIYILLNGTDPSLPLGQDYTIESTMFNPR